METKSGALSVAGAFLAVILFVVAIWAGTFIPLEDLVSLQTGRQLAQVGNQDQTVVLTPEADAAVRSGSHQSANFGTGAELGIIQSGGDWNIQPYLRFNLSGISGNLVSARLRFYVSDGDDDASPKPVSLSVVNDDSWGETTLTWQNKPATGNTIASITFDAADDVYTSWFDVTSYLQSELADGRASFSLTHSNGGNYVGLASRDAGHPAELEVVYNSGTQTPATYVLNTSASPSSGGTVSLSPNQSNYQDGTTVALTAVPSTGYQFDNWSGDLSGVTNPATLTMSANRSVIANFSQIPGQTGGGTLGSNSGYDLAWSTYLGGSSEETARDVVTDAAGNVYITGGTGSANFSPLLNAAQTTFGGNHDVFVAKFNASGLPQWSTYLGGPNYDRAYAIELDGAGNVYVAGRAGRNFPVTVGALQGNFAGDSNPNSNYGDQDGFVAKFNNAGQRVWVTYLGGPDRSFIRDIDVDSSGNVYAVLTDVSQANPYAASGAYQSNVSGGANGFVAKLNSSGNQVLWGTYVGGASSGVGFGTPSIRVTGSGEVVAMGTSNYAGDPVSPGLRAHAGGLDMYVIKLSADGRTRRWSTYLGGNGDEFSETHALALDNADNVYAAFTTRSSNMPVTGGVFQPALGGIASTGNYNGDGFVAKLNGSSGALAQATYLGGSSGEGLEGVGVDSSGEVYVSGGTFSANFPVTNDAYQSSRRGESDWFVGKLSSDFSTLLYSTYLGGTSNCAGSGKVVCDYARGSYVTNSGDFYVVGHTNSSNFPTVGAYLAANPSGSNVNTAAVLKVSTGGVVTPPTSYTINASVSGGNGSISPSGSVNVSAGGSRTFTFSPAGGYVVTSVLIDGAAVNPTPSASYTFSNVTSNRSIVVTFASASPQTVSLTASASPANGGVVSRSPNLASYSLGTVVTLTATPAAGYQFAGWSGALSGSINPATVLLDQDRSVTANFSLVTTGDPLVLRLEYNDVSSDGQTTDASVYGNHGVCAGAACPNYLASGSEDNSGTYQFDGTSDVISLPDSVSLRPTRDLTIATWINFDSVSGQQAIISRLTSNGFAWSLATHWQNPREFYLALDNDGASPGYFATSVGANLQANTWYHLAAVFDGNSVVLYKNGQPLSTATTGTRPASLYTGTAIPRVGAFASSGYLAGRLDRTRVFASALNSSEVGVLAQTSTGSLDVTPPTVLIVSPAPNASLSGAVSLSAAAADTGSGIASVRFLVDGAVIGQDLVTSPYVTVWNTATVNNGGHQLTVEARDVAGNLATSAPVNVIVNNLQTVGAITPSLVASRISGAAPLSVFFDATGTTHSNPVIRPFHDLEYRWSFGDSTSGVWSTTGQSRNEAIGALAAHVFEKPGNYSVVLTVTDNQGDTKTRSTTVSVSAPTSGACYSTSGNFSGCPTGLQQVTTSQISGNGFYRRGETFTRTGNLSNVTFLGAFGTGPRPRLVFSGAPQAIGTKDKTLVMGLEIVGGGYVISGGGLNAEHLFVVDNVFRDFTTYAIYKAPFSRSPERAAEYNAFVGNSFDTASASEHGIRTYIAKSYIGHNRIEGNYYRGTNIKFVGLGCVDGSNDYNIIADNYFSHRAAQGAMLSIGSGDAGHVNCSKDLIVERNIFDNPVAGWPKAAMGAGTTFERVTIRNNVGREMSHFISNTGEAGGTYPDWKIYNNLFYNSNLFPEGYYFLLSKGAMPNLELRNNIVHAFGGSTRIGVELQKDTLANITETNNLWYGDFQTLFNLSGTKYSFAQWQAAGQGAGSSVANPQLVQPGSGNFTLNSNSPAIDQGFAVHSVVDDLDGNYRPHDGNNSGTSEWDIGPHEFGSTGGGNPDPGVTTYTITINSGVNGTVTPGTVTLNAGSNQTFTIVPNSGYQITNVIIDGAPVGPVTQYQFSNLQSNHQLDVIWSSIVPIDNVPPVISGVGASGISQTGATISWQTDEPATRQVEYGFTTAYGQQTVFDSSLRTSHSVVLSGLTPGVTYHFRVSSRDAIGNSARSINFTFSTQPSPVPDQTSPGAVQNLTAVLGGAGITSTLLSWNAPAQNGADQNSGPTSGYDLRYSLAPLSEANWPSALAATGEPPPSAPGLSDRYTLVGLTPDTVYYAALKSVDAAGNVSPLSNVVSFKTLPLDPIPPNLPGGGGSGSSDSNPSNFALGARALPGPSQAIISWTKPTDSNYVRTLIVRSDKALTTSQLSTQVPEQISGARVVYEGDGQSFTDTGLTAGRTYYYGVFAYNKARRMNAGQGLSVKPLKAGDGQHNDLTPIDSAENNLIAGAVSSVNNCVTTPVNIAARAVVGPFGVGLTSPQVRILQEMLATDPTLYPEKVVDGYYGQAVIRAVQRFQDRQGLVRSGSPETTGYGLAGPRTRQELNRVLGVARVAETVVCPSASGSIDSSLGANPLSVSPFDWSGIIERLRQALRLFLSRLSALILWWS